MYTVVDAINLNVLYIYHITIRRNISTKYNNLFSVHNSMSFL